MPRLKVAGDRKTAICDALLRIAAAEGIAALTVERLAREVGVTGAALFRHFATRDAMLDGAGHRLAGLLLGSLPPADLQPVDRLRLFVLARLRMITEHPGIPQLVTSEQFAKALPPAGARALRGAIRQSVEFLAAAASEAAGRGEVRRDVPSEDIVILVMGALLARGLLAAHGVGPRARTPEETWQGLAVVLGVGRPDSGGSK
jgi:AcrR family transcriptional regulator